MASSMLAVLVVLFHVLTKADVGFISKTEREKERERERLTDRSVVASYGGLLGGDALAASV